MLKEVHIKNETATALWVQSENPTPHPSRPVYVLVLPGAWVSVWAI